MPKKPAKSTAEIAPPPAKTAPAAVTKSPKPAKKKAAAEVAPPPPPPVEKKWQHIGGPPAGSSERPGMFSRHDMQVLEIAQLRLNEAKQKAELLKLSIERFAREAQEKIKSSQADLKRMNDDSEARAQELMALYGELEQAYNLAMRDITYDPKTGRIMRAPPGALDRA